MEDCHTCRDLNEIYECFNEYQTVYMRDAVDVVNQKQMKTLRNLQEKDIKLGNLLQGLIETKWIYV